jgi:hypothetical protein
VTTWLGEEVTKKILAVTWFGEEAMKEVVFYHMVKRRGVFFWGGGSCLV